MAAFMMNNAYLTVNGVALSDHVTSITFSREADQLETTAMGDNNRTYIGGLQTGTLDLEMNQDLASGEVEATLYTLLGTTTTCVVKNDAAAASATNPVYTFDVLVTELPSANGAVGERSTVSVSWPITGAVTKATS